MLREFRGRENVSFRLAYSFKGRLPFAGFEFLNAETSIANSNKLAGELQQHPDLFIMQNLYINAVLIPTLLFVYDKTGWNIDLGQDLNDYDLSFFNVFPDSAIWSANTTNIAVQRHYLQEPRTTFDPRKSGKIEHGFWAYSQKNYNVYCLGFSIFI